MALSYLAGSQVGLNAFYDDLITFMTGIGWTVSETVNTRDKILKSTGTDGKVSMVYRVSASTSAANPFKAPANAHLKFPWILVQGYGAWTPGSPGTGFKPFGQVGPWAFGNPVLGGVVSTDTARIHRYQGTFPVTASPDSAYLGRTRRAKTSDSFENQFLLFDGRRKVLGPNITTQTQVGWSDLSHGEANVSSGGLPPGNFNTLSPLPVLVHDPVNDKDFIFIFNSTGTLAQQWLRYDIETNTWATMGAPTWTASIPNNSAAVWDGNDTIYALHGATTTEFAKYSISGNSWTNLTASPVARSSSFGIASTGTQTNMVFIPNSVSGIGEDVIYVALAATGTVIYRYDCTSNAWRSTSGTGALTAQQTMSASSLLFWDGIKNLYHSSTNAAPGTWYTSNVAVAPNTWTSMGSIQSALRAYTGIAVVNHVPCKVRSHATATTNYWFLGDLDSITVVVKIGTATPHYYWMYFGRFSGSNRTDIMTTTATANAGGRVTITVDDTSKYSAGEPVIVWNPADGTSERVTIFDILSSTTFRANLVNTYPTGSRIGIDPTQWIASGNGFGLCPTDAAGTGSDNETAQYVIEPTADSGATNRSSPGVRNLYQPVPLTIFNADSTTTKFENRGFLKNTFSMSTGAYPNLQAEEMIKIAGKTYIFFPDTETSRYTIDTRGVLIGPID